jgi:hypothetical protein
LSTALQWMNISAIIQIGISLFGFMLTAMSLMKSRNLMQMSQKL